MAQAGIHALFGAAARNIPWSKQGLLLGIILGNLAPDLDNLAVAAATLTGGSTEGLHRTFTHSFLTAGAVILVFYAVGFLSKKPQISRFGLGLGIGMIMHTLLDLLIWFDGVQILWPLASWVNLWRNVSPPDWFAKLMMPVEFLFMAAFVWMLIGWAKQAGSDPKYVPVARGIVYVLLGLFVTFTILVYVMETGFMTLYGALYLIALGFVIGVTIRMRRTISTMEMEQFSST